MSRSPIEAAAPSDVVANYRQGWSALSELIGQGRSFSGYERNCTFLNIKGKRFATASAATGLDLIDDSRAIATCDWDDDGHLDLWVMNRTAPRVRFLRNQGGQWFSLGTSLQLELRGTTSNRDAIGARVVVKLKGDPKPMVRTVRAGDGFLSQSSKRLHFGFDSTSELERLTVHWPSGKAEDFDVSKIEIGAKSYLPRRGRASRAERDGTFLLTQGGAIDWPNWTERLPEKAPAAAVSNREAATRTWIIGRVPMPGTEENLGKPTLLNLWSSTCSDCVSELTEWTKAEKRIRTAGLDIVALSVDHLSGDPVTRGEAFLKKINFPFKHDKATQAQVNAMEVVHRTFVERQQPLPVPTSFLLDAQGRVAAIYKGRVTVETLLSDVALLNARLIVQRDSAVPYPGRWSSRPFSANPNRVAATFEKAGQINEAAAYLEQFLSGARDYLQGEFGSTEQQLITVITAHTLLGDFLLKLQRSPKASLVYANLLKLAPKDGDLHQSIGEHLLRQNLAKPALAHLKLANSLLPQNANLAFNTGLASLGSGQAKQALSFFQNALKLQPNDPVTLYQMAAALELLNRREEAITHCRAALKARPNWDLAEQKLATLLRP
ncbi:MAG: redoxin domain-containing protein [Verrucomicrobiaceae bacterium]|nr:redoxin domain-containing protein [Verrucomicrobiaceae bacterium]